MALSGPLPLKYQLFFDGSIQVNPGGAIAWGFVITDLEGKALLEGCNCASPNPGNTVNVSEYLGLIQGLELVLVTDWICNCSVRVLGDSQLVVRQMTGQYQVKNGALQRLNVQVKQLSQQLRSRGVIPAIRWIPREENGLADELSKRGYSKDPDPSILFRLR